MLFAPFLSGTKVLFDFRGHGDSERPGPGAYSMAHFAGDVEAVASTFGATCAAGVSLGSGAILRLLCSRPDRFERLVSLLPARLELSPTPGPGCFTCLCNEPASARLLVRMLRTQQSGVEVGGDLLDFTEFFHAQYERLIRALYLLTGHPEDAEDLAQEALARVFERWDRVQGMESPSGYLYAVAFNLNRRRLRRLLRRSTVQVFDQASPTDSPVDPSLSAAVAHDVRQALKSLPPSQREVLILVEWLGLEPQEAGSFLGIAPGLARVRLHRAKQAVRHRLGEGDE